MPRSFRKIAYSSSDLLRACLWSAAITRRYERARGWRQGWGVWLASVRIFLIIRTFFFAYLEDGELYFEVEGEIRLDCSFQSIYSALVSIISIL